MTVTTFNKSSIASHSALRVAVGGVDLTWLKAGLHPGLVARSSQEKTPSALPLTSNQMDLESWQSFAVANNQRVECVTNQGTGTSVRLADLVVTRFTGLVFKALTAGGSHGRCKGAIRHVGSHRYVSQRFSGGSMKPLGCQSGAGPEYNLSTLPTVLSRQK